MAGAEGFVVFQRGKESDESDIWDDTALIKAYDNAVSIMKSRLAEREGNDASEDNPQPTASGEEKTQTKKKKKRHRPKKKKQQWKVGDLCRAVFTEDGLLYDAEIIGLDTTAGTCTVRYTDYHNEEDHLLSELLPPRGAAKSLPNGVVSETDSNHDVTAQSPNAAGRVGRGRASGAASEQPMDSAPYYPPGMAYPPRFPPMHGVPSGAPRLPHMPPPPPPPPLMGEDAVSEDEALNSMLIAWYMSGYHTGYYQGLQQGKQQTWGGASR